LASADRAATRTALTRSDFGKNLENILPSVIGSTVGEAVNGGFTQEKITPPDPNFVQAVEDIKLQPSPALDLTGFVSAEQLQQQLGALGPVNPQTGYAASDAPNNPVVAAYAAVGPIGGDAPVGAGGADNLTCCVCKKPSPAPNSGG
jgi:hypothetical protein